MTRQLTPVRAALAAALGCAASVALAQVPPTQGTYTLVSAALPKANEFSCTVTNVSSQAVTLNTLMIVFDGSIMTNQNATCIGNLPAGENCTVRTAVQLYRGEFVPHCRARFTAAYSVAVVGSLRGSYVNGATTQDLAVLPMQPLTGVTLSNVMSQP
jgi:hypothetical protein